MGWGGGAPSEAGPGLSRGDGGGGPDPSQAPPPPMEPCPRTAQEPGPREQAVEPTLIPGSPQWQASYLLRAPSPWACAPVLPPEPGAVSPR